jgi:hypothetical protein
VGSLIAVVEFHPVPAADYDDLVGGIGVDETGDEFQTLLQQQPYREEHPVVPEQGCGGLMKWVLEKESLGRRPGPTSNRAGAAGKRLEISGQMLNLSGHASLLRDQRLS